jgi:UDP-N-acetylglucosamine 2-epimerase
MGEDPATVFTFGSPIIDSLRGIDTSLDNSLYERYPRDVGHIDLTAPYMLVIQHPVTTEYADNYRQTVELLAAVKQSGLPLFFISPNIDAGSDGVNAAMREFRAGADLPRAVFHKHVSLEDYTKLLANAAVAVGNSSSLIREAAYLGTPVVLAGTRQQYRERGGNVVEVPAEREAIARAIEAQRAHGRFAPDMRFGDGTAAPRIAETLATIDLARIPVQKYFNE